MNIEDFVLYSLLFIQRKSLIALMLEFVLLQINFGYFII